MVLRLVLAAALLLALTVLYARWRKPSRRLSMAELGDLGIRGPAVVEFVTKTCAPCRAVAPRLRDAAAVARVPFAQIDVGTRPEVARIYGIRSVPTVAVTGPGGRVMEVWTSVPADGQVADAARRAQALRR